MTTTQNSKAAKGIGISDLQASLHERVNQTVWIRGTVRMLSEEGDWTYGATRFWLDEVGVDGRIAASALCRTTDGADTARSGSFGGTVDYLKIGSGDYMEVSGRVMDGLGIVELRINTYEVLAKSVHHAKSTAGQGGRVEVEKREEQQPKRAQILRI